MPAKFQTWRPNQEEALRRLLSSTKRVKALSAPTGFGKTAVYVAYALLTNVPTCFVTDNRALQDQLMEDFACVGLVDIRGRRNYLCDLKPDYTCEDGYAARCPHKGSILCPASQAEMRAAGSALVVTNYDKWTSARKFGQGMEHFQQVVLDEGHEAPAALARAMQVILGDREIEDLLELDFPTPREAVEFVNWKPWAAVARHTAEEMMLAARELLRDPHHKPADVREYLHLRNLTKRLATIATASADNWVVDEVERGYQFDPVRVGRYSEAALLLGIPSILVVSATLRPKTLYMIGVGKDHFDFQEFDSDFDPSRCPIYYVPTMRVDSRVADLSMLWVRLDQIVSRRTDRKGIVHTICVEPKTRIVTSDLRWIRADEVRVGQSLLGFDEFPSRSVGGSRQWRESLVEDVDVIERPCIKLTLAGGQSLVCSAEHLWLTHNGAEPRWTRADHLMTGEKASSHLMRVLDVWDSPLDWKHGYLSAAFDGEGSLHQKNYKRVGKTGDAYCRTLSLGFSQNWGGMLHRVLSHSSELGFSPTLYSHRDCKLLRISRKSDVLRFLGEVRPERLLSKLDVTALGKFSLLERVEVISRESVGTQRVVFIKTNTGTFIAEGFASHNSYARRDEILARSRFASQMLINQRGEASTGIVMQFKHSPPGTILVSPSVGAGFDFPMRECEWQFVCKIPFPDSRSKIVKARQEDDKEYGPYQAVNKLVQIFGRGMRSKADQCENFIGDSHLDWFLPKYSHLAPKSFKGFFRRVEVLPQPPARL